MAKCEKPQGVEILFQGTICGGGFFFVFFSPTFQVHHLRGWPTRSYFEDVTLQVEMVHRQVHLNANVIIPQFNSKRETYRLKAIIVLFPFLV